MDARSGRHRGRPSITNSLICLCRASAPFMVSMMQTATASNAQEPLLSVSDLHVKFGSLRAVDGVSFSLRPGDLLGLIGPNGSGKTTLLRAITTLQPLSRGTMRLFGDKLSPDNPQLLS